MAAVSDQAKAKRKQYFKDWYVRNKDTISANAKERYQQNRDQVLARQRAAGTQRPYLYKKKYGITVADYDRMFLEQGGKCKICGVDKPGKNTRTKYFHVDHCHKTGRVRGLLCISCNVLLGQFENRLDAVLNYLREI